MHTRPEIIDKYMKLAENGLLNAILCKYEGIPDYLEELCGEVSKVWRIQWTLDEGYICTIGTHGYWVRVDDLIIIDPTL